MRLDGKNACDIQTHTKTKITLGDSGLLCGSVRLRERRGGRGIG
jgi:hypothetical protein